LLGEVIAREIATQLLGARRSADVPGLLPPDRGRPPRREARASVPCEYQQLIGHYAEHPGEGKGKGALARGVA
jgi:DNA (cytosine-5)-methyltransferase 1